MFKRKIEEKFLEWKMMEDHKPLVVKGVRQCGKTFSVLSFARENYKHVVYFDFRAHPEYESFFLPNLDVSSIVMRMSALKPGFQAVAHETCFIFDELQDCPAARSSLKYFALDGRYDVICTGSLLGVNGYRKDIEDVWSIPVGYEHIIDMYPMDFEEWLWANGIEKIHFDYLQRCLNELTPVEPAIHFRMRQLLNEYVIAGGMPEAVKTFLKERNVGQLLAVQRRIVEQYRSDMVKYAPDVDKPRIRECFNSIPAQLAKEYKKFTYSSVSKGGRGRDYAGSLQWIEDAGIIRRCYNLQITELPLDGNSKRDEFKVYMGDVGLLTSMLEKGVQSDIIQGNMYGYKGAIYENLVADILGKSDRKLYYYHKDGGIELDFVVRQNNECMPIECKATTGNAKSLKTILGNPDKYHVEHAVKVGDYNIGLSGGLLTLPTYMLGMWLEKY